MAPSAIDAAMARSEAAAAVLEKHKAALFPHLAILLRTFGPDYLRSIVSGAVEAVIIADRRLGRQEKTLIPFEGGEG